MRILHISFSDSEGGAARAAYRIHESLRKHGIDSRMMVASGSLGDWTVCGPQTRMERLVTLLRKESARLLRSLLKTSNPILHSPAWLPSRWLRRINASNADVVHLHWIAGEMLSIRDIARIRKPIVWTLHDMWAFCGAEHYTTDDRWRGGHSRHNRPSYESGFDLNRWTWIRKKIWWKKPLQIVAPSDWLARCAKQSALMATWPVEMISSPIDLEAWSPIDHSVARNLLRLPQEVSLVLFGAEGGSLDPRKGFDLLAEALQILKNSQSKTELVIFGELMPKKPRNLGFPVHYVGKVFDDTTLRLLYSACDVFVLPSRLDNLPLTVEESMACGTPVVGFANCGLPTVIRHKTTGYLAPAFDTGELAQGIKWVLNHPKPQELRLEVRAAAEDLFSFAKITQRYSDLYKKVLKSHNQPEKRQLPN